MDQEQTVNTEQPQEVEKKNQLLNSKNSKNITVIYYVTQLYYRR